MVLKNDLYLWKIDYNELNWPFRLSYEPDFINTFLTFDMQNRILKDIGIFWDRKFYDSI